MNAVLLRSTDTRKGHTVNLVLTVRRRSSFLIVSLNPADVRVGWHVDALRLHSLYPACAREQGFYIDPYGCKAVSLTPANVWAISLTHERYLQKGSL
jgi:hypothetical protein